jgi:PAS domain S-box-containing protein
VSRLESVKLLLVDDRPENLLALEAILEPLGHELIRAGSGEEALKHLLMDDFAVILLDVQMPVMDGFQTAAFIKQREKTRHVPIIFLTAISKDLHHVFRGYSAGAVDYLFKPFEPAVLRSKVAVFVELFVKSRQLEAQARELERHARVLEHVGEGVFLVDADGIVRLWNLAAEGITGLTADGAIGQPVEEVVPGWEAVAPLVPLTTTPAAGRSPAETVPIEFCGRELWLSASAVGFSDGTVYAFRDVTEERALEQLKTDFVATVSHELRTPLAAIYGSAMTLRRRDSASLTEETRRHLLSIIAEESDRLARIVNDILLASHLDSGRLTVARRPVDAGQVVEQAVESMRPLVPDGTSLEVFVPDGATPLDADPDKLRQVLVNLIENAIKYSPDGGLVQVSVEPRQGNVRFAVVDEGLGIPREEQERIFEKFYRLDPNLARGVGGTGLGLYICRELVRRMDGRIWVSSQPGQGSSFFVELPIAVPAAAAEPVGLSAA